MVAISMNSNYVRSNEVKKQTNLAHVKKEEKTETSKLGREAFVCSLRV